MKQEKRTGVVDRHYATAFRWEEFYKTTVSDKSGTSMQAVNYPRGDDAEEVYRNILHLCRYYLQPLRNHWQEPVVINSGYRCRQVNKAVGGADDSWHLKGCAADIRMPSPLVACQTVAWFHERFVKLGIPYQELLLSKSRSGGLWLHIAFNPDPQKSALRCRVMSY